MKERKADEAGYKIYKVGAWKDAKAGKDDEKRVVYSCDNCGVNGYYEEAMFVYLYNKANSKSLNYIDEVKKEAKVTSKEQYRSIELAFEKK